MGKDPEVARDTHTPRNSHAPWSLPCFNSSHAKAKERIIAQSRSEVKVERRGSEKAESTGTVLDGAVASRKQDKNIAAAPRHLA